MRNPFRKQNIVEDHTSDQLRDLVNAALEKIKPADLQDLKNKALKKIDEANG